MISERTAVKKEGESVSLRPFFTYWWYVVVKMHAELVRMLSEVRFLTSVSMATVCHNKYNQREAKTPSLLKKHIARAFI